MAFSSIPYHLLPAVIKTAIEEKDLKTIKEEVRRPKHGNSLLKSAQYHFDKKWGVGSFNLSSVD